MDEGLKLNNSQKLLAPINALTKQLILTKRLKFFRILWNTLNWSRSIYINKLHWTYQSKLQLTFKVVQIDWLISQWNYVRWWYSSSTYVWYYKHYHNIIYAIIYYITPYEKQCYAFTCSSHRKLDVSAICWLEK